MKKMIIIILITFIFLPLKNKELNFDIFKEFKELVLRKEKCLFTIMKIESNFNEKAINKRSKASGILQMFKIAVDEANRISGFNYSYDDRFNFSKSIEMFYIINDYWNSEYNPEKVARFWCGGFLPKHKTDNYYNKFLKNYNL